MSWDHEWRQQHKSGFKWATIYHALQRGRRFFRSKPLTPLLGHFGPNFLPQFACFGLNFCCQILRETLWAGSKNVNSDIWSNIPRYSQMLQWVDLPQAADKLHSLHWRAGWYAPIQQWYLKVFPHHCANIQRAPMATNLVSLAQVHQGPNHKNNHDGWCDPQKS